MAKENVVIVPLTKKQKILNVLRIIGICFGAMVGLVALVVLYVGIFVGFTPEPVPLTAMNFEKNEYVISELDTIKLVPNEGCTELDNVTIKILDTNIVKLVEDDNTKPQLENSSEQDENSTETAVVEKYSTKIGVDIKIEPVKKTVNVGTADEKEINVGGWVKLVAERGLITTDCWVFVDVKVESLDLTVETQLDEVPDQELPTFEVHPGSTVQLGYANILPEKSADVPSTTLSVDPNGKNSTNYTKIKKVYYELVMYEDGYISGNVVDINKDTGSIKISSNAEGKFKVRAYILCNYNDIGNEPSQEKYLEIFGEPVEAYRNWEQDFDLIRVKTQEIVFVIKDNLVENISVAKEKLNYDLLANNVKVQIDPTNTTSNYVDSQHSNVYCYGLDIQMSFDSDIKNDLYNDIELFAGYITDEATNSIYVGDKWITIDDTYFKISKVNNTLSWNVVVNEYRERNNVFVFRYPLGNDEYKYDYVEVGINKVSVEGLTFSSDISSEMELAWNDSEGKVQTLDLANTVSVSPSNATFNNKDFIKYFALSDNGVLEVDNSIKIKTSDNKEYSAICKTDGQNTIYNFINPLGVGKVNIVVGVLKYDASGQAIIENGYYQLEYVGLLADSISVNVVKNISVSNVEIYDAGGNLISTNNQVSISKGDTIKVKIICDDALQNDNAFTWAVEGDDKQDMLSQTNNVGIEDKNTLVYTLCADKDGSYNFYIADKNGNKITYVDTTFAFEVLNTELQALSLTSNSNKVGVQLTSDSYSWVVYDEDGNLGFEQLSFGLEFEPANTNNTEFDLYVYGVPDDFTSDQLKDLDIETLDISDLILFEADYKDDISAMIPKIQRAGKVVVYAATPSNDIISNPVLIEITLPDIKVEFSYGNAQTIVAVDSLTKNLTTYDKLDELDGKQGDKFRIGIYQKTNDSTIVSDKTYYELVSGEYLVVDSPSVLYISDYYEFVDISALISYKFAGDYTESDGLLISKKSGIKIDNSAKTLQLCDIDNSISETIVMYTDFGFETSASQSFVYNLVADYDVTKNSNEFYAPSLVDIFGNYREVVNVDMTKLSTYYEYLDGKFVLTTDVSIDTSKTYYQFVEPAVKFTNHNQTILYLPEGYNLNYLADSYKNQFIKEVEEPTDEDIKTYYELNDGKYVLTTDTSVDTNKTYYVYNIRYNLTLNIIGNYYGVTTDGRIRLYRIPTDDLTVSIELAIAKPDGTTGYSQQYLFTIKAGVQSDFEYNDYSGNNPVYVVQGIAVDGSDGNYKFTSGNELDVLSNIKYTTLNDSTVTIRSVTFASNYISMLGVDALNGSTIVKYVKTSDTAIDGSKTYYVLTSNGYEKVLQTNIDDISNYYEVGKTYATYANGVITLMDELLENDIQEFEVKLEISVKIENDGISTYLTDYYIIRFEIPKA